MAQTCPACASTYDAGTSFCPNDGSRLTSEKSTGDRSGQVIADRYRLLRLVGEGGMGEVYEAEHLYIHKRVALKLLRPEVAKDPQVVQRFQQEARATSAIGHDNIVQIEDFGPAAEGAVFLAMEWLNGETLEERQNKERLSSALALQVASGVCSGVYAAHQAGIIHRDLKPANIFLVDHADSIGVKVLDFGIAKLMTNSSNLTSTGTFVGTPNYMAPEQAFENQIDERVDVYAMGVVLYEMFTGQLPFIAPTPVGVLHLHASKEPESSLSRGRLLGLDISPEVDVVIMRCLQKSPDDRYASIGDLGAAIDALRDTEAPEGLEPSRAEIFQPETTTSDDLMTFNKKSPLVYLVPVAVVGLVVVAVLLLSGKSSEEAVANADTDAAATQLLADGAPVALSDAAVVRPLSADASPHLAPPDAMPLADAAPALGTWSHTWKDSKGDFRISVSPALVPVNEVAKFELVASLRNDSAHSDDVAVTISFTHFRNHDNGGSVSGNLQDGALVFEKSFKRPGKYHATVAVSDKKAVLAKTRFDLCVGISPTSAKVSDTCPRMNPKRSPKHRH